MADVFTNVSTGINYNSMHDEHELVKITEKNVTVGDIGKIVQGEINSQEIEFSIPRYYDNVDLLDKKFNILYQTKGGIFKVEAIDVAYNVAEYSGFFHLTAPSAVHLTTCFTPDSQHHRLSVMALLPLSPLQRFNSLLC